MNNRKKISNFRNECIESEPLLPNRCEDFIIDILNIETESCVETSSDSDTESPNATHLKRDESFDHTQTMLIVKFKKYFELKKVKREINGGYCLGLLIAWFKKFPEEKNNSYEVFRLVIKITKCLDEDLLKISADIEKLYYLIHPLQMDADNSTAFNACELEFSAPKIEGYFDQKTLEEKIIREIKEKELVGIIGTINLSCDAPGTSHYSILVTDILPTPDNLQSFTIEAGYLLSGKNFFYINKTEAICESININSTQIESLTNQLVIKNFKKNQARKLTYKELYLIKTLTNHEIIFSHAVGLFKGKSIFKYYDSNHESGLPLIAWESKKIALHICNSFIRNFNFPLGINNIKLEFTKLSTKKRVLQEAKAPVKSFNLFSCVIQKVPMTPQNVFHQSNAATKIQKII